MRTPRRLAAVLTATAVLVAACTQQTAGSGSRIADPSVPGAATPSSPAPSAPSATPSLPPAPVPAAIQFRDCTAALESAGVPIPPALHGKLQFGCATFPVPLDYAHPDGTKIALTIVRIHDTDNTTSPSRPLMINPGGPGAPAIDYTLSIMGELPTSVLTHYDLIGFDPRGVDLSTPIHCISNAQKDAFYDQAPDPTTLSGFIAAQKLAKGLADACAKAVGSGLQFYNTADTARDMDQIRQGLRAAQTNYLGFSYGTQLGWAYAQLFPSKVGAFVLDGAIDPDSTPLQQLAGQVQGFEDAFDQFEVYCKTVSPCNTLADPRQTASKIAETARTSPLSTGTSRKLTVGLTYTGILEALYSKSLWPQLATGLVNGTHGDGSALLSLADRYTERQPDGTYTNILDANTTIDCNDSPPGPTNLQAHQLATEWAKKYPLFGRWQAGSVFSCQQWQPNRTPVPHPEAATKTKVLVVGNLHDPATPYQGAKDLAHDFANAELLSWNGEGHTSYLQGSKCIDNYVTNYLTKLALPPENTLCPAQ